MKVRAAPVVASGMAAVAVMRSGRADHTTAAVVPFVRSGKADHITAVAGLMVGLRVVFVRLRVVVV